MKTTILDHIIRVASIFVLLFIIDVVLLAYAKKYKPTIKNKYYKWHEECGFAKLLLFKLGLAFILLYSTYASPFSGGFDGAFLTAYAIIIILFGADLAKRSSSKDSEAGGQDNSKKNV